MRTITQTPNPSACLAAQPAGLDWYAFMQTPCHGDVADSLRGEQHRLCCYCEAKIDSGKSHVEHLVPRSRNRAWMYTYSNLAASCNGGEGENRHCGHHKAGKYAAALFVSPHNAAASTLFAYGIDGSIEPVAPATHAQAEYMRSLLNLDCPSLRGRRHSHARAVISTLGPSPAQELIDWARGHCLQPDANGALRQFHSLSKELLS